MLFFILLATLISSIVFLRIPSKMFVIHAGKPNKRIKREIEPDQEYNLDGQSMDLAKYSVGKIYGESLAPENVLNGSIVFFKHRKIWNWFFNKSDYEKYIKPGAFLIFRNDSKRVKLEYPDREIINGYKIRKVIKYVDTNITKEDIATLIRSYDVTETGNIERIYNKLEFAKNYYKEDKLIMSITYRKDNKIDFSFHSYKFLRGVVKYISVQDTRPNIAA